MNRKFIVVESHVINKSLGKIPYLLGDKNIKTTYYIKMCSNRKDEKIKHGKPILAELWLATRACKAPWVSKSIHSRKFGNHVTVHRPQPARPSAPQGNQCSISHFLASLGAQED